MRSSSFHGRTTKRLSQGREAEERRNKGRDRMAGRPRIAIGGILTECNHFGGLPIDMESFAACELFRGAEVLELTNSVVGGMLNILMQSNAEPVPLLYASACPGGPITGECYRQLRGELLQYLKESMPIDGILLPLHGSALVEGLDDPEGQILKLVRQLVGPSVPVVATLDLHANVTADMVQSADALLAWETYPHSDQYFTGGRAARLLIDIFDEKCRPTMVAAKVPVITSAIHGSTHGKDPFADLMRLTKSLERRPRVLSTSLFLVHPYMDVAGMGSGGLVITDNDIGLAEEYASGIAMQYWQRRCDLEPETCTPAEAIVRGLEIDGGPVILVEAADCCGGGAAGDSIATLSSLVDSGTDQLSFVPVVDPAAAAACHLAGTGMKLTLTLGHQLDSRWGIPRQFCGTVESLNDGRFTYCGGQWEGRQVSMGPTAVFAIGAIRVVIMSRATYDWADEQIRTVGLNPCDAKFIVAKNPMNYRLAYGSIAKASIILDTPGPTPPTLRNVPFTKLQRPWFPADADLDDLRLCILKS